MKKPIDILLIGALVTVVVGGAVILWKLQQPMPDADFSEPVSEAASMPNSGVVGELPASSPPVVSLPDPLAAASAALPVYPIDQVASDVPVAVDAQAPSPTVEDRLKAGLLDIIGKKAFLTFVQSDGLINRVVATVDNLPRSHATTRLWPVNPVAGRFSTSAASGDGGKGVISAANTARYAAFVKFVESVDARHTVNLYKQLYPAFQSAYAELGYPKQYFNDRLIEVIDHLLATPVPETLPEVQQTVVKGPIPSAQPWAHYVYVDPALEGLSSGQKVLLRVGPEHAKRLKAKLQDFRSRLGRMPKTPS